jgi:hypothetical protein
MIKHVKQLFKEILEATEIQKVDYKRDQYNLVNENTKADFIKDILCIANAPGNDGYVLLGVKSEKGKPRKVVGISHHYDSSDLEVIVNSIIDPPIQFEYYPLNYQGVQCALLYIPKSKAKPHWPRKDFGKLERHIIYTRRSSGNREASIQEIRAMCVETMQLSDIARRKTRVSPHVLDELRDMSLDDRKVAMYKMLKTIAPKIGLVKYKSIKDVSPYYSGQVCALASSISDKSTHNFTILMYPWWARLKQISGAYLSIKRLISDSMKTKLTASLRSCLKDSILVHISYKCIYTRAMELRRQPLLNIHYSFSNAWKEPWGRIIKWESNIPEVHIENDEEQQPTSYQKKTRYEFFVPCVTSKAELEDRLEKVLAWVDSNIT